jgi:hypothetical protein
MRWVFHTAKVRILGKTALSIRGHGQWVSKKGSVFMKLSKGIDIAGNGDGVKNGDLVWRAERL